LRLARTVIAAFAGPEGTLALRPARTILGSFVPGAERPVPGRAPWTILALRAAGTERPVAGRAARALVVAARTGCALTSATGGSGIAVVTAGAILTGGCATALARGRRFLFLGLTHETLHHDLAAFAG
jgi:hypothetical protein